MKKKLLIFVAVATLSLFTVHAVMAAVDNYSNISLARGTGTYVGNIVKKSGNGNAGLAVNASNSAIMYMQVRKTDGVAASEYRVFNGLGSDSSVPYMVDGYGNSLGRDGYSYKCRLAHRSQSTATTTVASGGWWP